MKQKSFIALALVGLLAAAGAHAENYDGVHPLTTQANRAEVRADAVYAAHHADPYDDGAQAGVPAIFASAVSRATERTQAVVAAHSPNPYAEGYGAGVPQAIASDTSRAAVRAEAVATARQPRLNIWGKAY